MRKFDVFEKYHTPENWKQTAYLHKKKEKIKLKYSSLAAVCLLAIVVGLSALEITKLSLDNYTPQSQSDWNVTKEEEQKSTVAP